MFALTAMALDVQAQDKKPEEPIRQAFNEEVSGFWSLISHNVGGGASEDQVKLALVRCNVTRQLDRVTVEKEADQEVPDKGRIRGSVRYYLSEEKGLHRLDVDKKQVVRLTGFEQKRTSTDRPSFELSGDSGKVIVFFAKLKNASGSRKVMFENKSLYVACN